MSIVWCHELNTSEDLALDVAPGKQKLDIVRRFQILTDSMDDGPITVCSCNDLPTPFSIYQKGHDYATYSVATTCKARRVKKQPLLWNVQVGYTSAVDFDQSAPQSGQPDLTCFLPQVRNWKIAEEKTVWQARLQLPGETYAETMVRAKTAVVNSANDLFADGVTVVKNIRGWEIRRYEWYFNETQADDYTDVVNKDTCWNHPPGTVKMVAITGESETVNDVQIWRVSYEFHICDPGGWGVEILDNGMRLWCKNDGTVPANRGEATGFAVIKDKACKPVATPQLLDGAGYDGTSVSAVLAPGGTPFVATWHYLEEATFGDIQPMLPSMGFLNIIT